MASRTLYPAIVDPYMPAFNPNEESCKVYFSLSKFNARKDVSSVHIAITKQDTGMNVVNITKNSGGRYRATGIILNAGITEVEGEDNLYYVTITNEDLKSSSGSYSGWIPGWVYKIQLRLSSVDYNGNQTSQEGQATWLNNNSFNFSEWSTVCIVKATGDIKYQLFSAGETLIDTVNINNNNYDIELQTSTLDITGHFIRQIDKKETIHSYSFILYDGDTDVVLEDTHEIYSNKYQDSDNIRYISKIELQNDKSYKLAFKFKTKNGYISGRYKKNEDKDDRISFTCKLLSSENPPCIIVNAENDEGYHVLEGINTAEHYHITPTMDDSPNPKRNETREITIYNKIIEAEEEEGRVMLKFYDPDDKASWNGNLCVRRTDSRSDFQIWEDIYIYVCKNQSINDIPVFYDYTVESGILYKYGVQSIDSLGYRGRLIENSNPVLRNFDNSFLLGQNNRQLKLKFDNTINNFKYQIFDSKIDTIGGKFPVIARNGAVQYRTFPITGLISFNMDENGTFYTKKEIYNNNETILDTYNGYNKINGINLYNDYIYEKDFRYKVLEFLQDGQLKLFKSPTEGNIIVRLTDVSCTPNQSLGRMIYSFSATAYEMAENTMENYLKYGFYEVGKWSSSFETYETRLGQISMDVPIRGNQNNIIEYIKQKYDTGNKNVAGQTRRIKNIHHVKITFDDKPLRVLNAANGGGEYVLGNNIYCQGKNIAKGGQQITVYKSGTYFYDNNDNLMIEQPIIPRLGVRMYEFDNRVTFNLNDKILILGDAENKKTHVHVTVDFLYDLKIEPYVGKQIKQKRERKGISQIFKYYKADTNIFREIYYKHYKETDTEFSRLTLFSSIGIEACPGAAFGIKDAVDTSMETHVVGATGYLELQQIENIETIVYLGIVNPETKEIEEKGTDILMDYIYIVLEGLYKEGASA